MFKFRIVINLILSVAIGIPSQGIPSVATTNPQLLTQISTPVTENIFSNAEKGARWVDLGLQNWFSTHFKSVAHSVVNDVAYTISATPTPITQATASITAVSSPLFALMAYHDSLGGLSVVAADGTRQRQIRATGDKPVWANYGDQLAFIDKDSSGKAQVFTMTSVGHNVIQVTHTSNGVCGLPSWSPNDDQIAFGITSAITGCDLYTISANGLGTPQLLISQVRAFTWLANNVFSYSQPSGSSDMLGTAQFVPASQQALSVASVKSPSIKALPAVVPQTCGQVTNIQYAHNGGGIAYQVACSTGGSKYFLTDLLTGGVTQTNTQPVVIWLPQHGLLYGSAGNFSYAGSVADVVTSSSVLVAALSGLMGDLSTAATTNFIVEPDPVAGDHIVDPDFLSNGQLQRQLTLSNSYDPATGEDTFSAPDIGSNNQRTQPYASGTGHVDPASGQYKPGADTGAVLPSYGLYNRVPFSDYADPVSRSYAGTFQGVSLPGRGSPLDFRITYDPTNAWEDWSSTGEIGPGWSHNFAIKLFLACKYLTGYAWETPTNGQIFLQQSNGARIKFQDNLYAGSNPQIGNTRWATLTPGVYATLERVNLNSNGDGSYVPTEKLVEGSSCFPSDSGSIVQQHVYLVTLADNTVYTFNWVGLLIKIDHVHNSTKNQDWHPLNLIYNVSFNNPPSNPIQWISTRPSGYTCSYYPFAKGYQLLRVEDRDPGAPQPNNYLDFCYGPPNVLSDITLAEIHDNRGGSSSGSPSFQMQYSTQYQGKSTIIGLTDWKGKAWSFTYHNLAHDSFSPHPDGTNLNGITSSFIVTRITGPMNVAIGLEYNINVNAKECSGTYEDKDHFNGQMFSALICTSLYQRISGIQQGDGSIVGKVETFTPMSQDSTHPSSVLFGNGTAADLVDPNTGGTYTKISNATPVGSVFYVGDGSSGSKALNPSKGIAIRTWDSTNGSTTPSDAYQTYFGYNNQARVTSINGTGAVNTALYDSGPTNVDMYYNISSENVGAHFVIYRYNSLTLPNEPASTPQNQTFLTHQVDDNITDGTTNHCRYSYVYSYNTASAYPTLPIQFDKYDLSNTTNAEPVASGPTGCTYSDQSLVARYKLTYYNLDAANNLDGLLESITDPSGAVTFYTYNTHGQLASQTKNYVGSLTGNETDALTSIPAFNVTNQLINVTTQYRYDADGRLTDAIDAVTGRNNHTAYCDSTNVVTQVLNYTATAEGCLPFPPQTASQNVQSATQVDDAGRLTRTVNALGQATNLTYDNAGRLSEISSTDASGTVVSQADYTYIAASAHTQVNIAYKRVVSGQLSSGPAIITDAVCYDVIHRVTAYMENLSAPTISCMPQDGGQTGHIGNADQNALTQITYSANTAWGHLPAVITNYTANVKTTFAYDPAGSIIQAGQQDTVVTAANGQNNNPVLTWNYGYDQFERLVNISDPKATPGSPLIHNQWFCYNMDGQVIHSIQNPYSIQNPSSTINIPACTNDDSGIAAVTGGLTGLWSAPPSLPTGPVIGTPTSNQDTNLQWWAVYDGLGRQTDSYDTLHRRTTTIYDMLGRVQSVTKNNTGTGSALVAFSGTTPDLNNTVTMAYDLSNRTQTQNDWLGHATFTHFDALGHKISVIQNNVKVPTQPDQNIVTLYQYDLLGRVIAQSDPAANPASVLNLDGTITGKQSSVVYDALGHKIAMTDPSGATTSTTYDAFGNPLTVQGPDTPPISYSYDGLLRPAQVTAGAITTAVCYNGYASSTERAVISTQNAPQNTPCPTGGSGYRQAKVTFNLLGEPTQVIRNYTGTPANSPTTPDTNVMTNYSYDLLGNLLQATLPNDTVHPTAFGNGGSQLFAYDGVNRPISSTQVVNGVQQTWQTRYDFAGRPAVQFTPQNIQTTTAYDYLDQVTGVLHSNGAIADSVAVNYTYANFGASGMTKRTTMTDSSSANPTVYNYDALDRLTSITGGINNIGASAAPLNNPLSYQYDQDGRRTQITLPDGRSVGYTYYDNSALASVILSNGWTTPGVVNYAYQTAQINGQSMPSHRLSQIQYPNNVTETVDYDTQLRLKALDYATTNTGTKLMHIDYALDNFNNRTSATEYLQQAAPTANPETDTIGVFRSTGVYYLRQSNTAGYPDITVNFSAQIGGAASTPVAGDWTGAGSDTIGAYLTSGVFKLCHQNDTTVCTSAANIDQVTYGGAAGDVPLAGHWFSTMLHDGLGIARVTSGLVFLFKNTLASGFPDTTEVLGIPGDQSLTGDWASTGIDGPGVYRPSSGLFFLSNQVTSGTVYTNTSFVFGPNSGGYTALSGNWTGSASGFGVGLFQSITGLFQLKNQLTSGSADKTFLFGSPGDAPIAGHWAVSGGHAPPVHQAPNILVTPSPMPGATPQGGSAPGGSQIGGSHVQPVLPNPKSQSEPVLFNPLPVNPLSMLQSGSYPGLLQRQIAYSYDGLSRLLSAQYKDNGAASFNYQYTYDLNSNRLTTLGQNLLNPTHSTFDATTYTYNDANQVQTAVDQNGKTTFVYYLDGMLGFQSYQPVNNVNSASTIGYTYDAADRLSKVVNALTNQTTNYTYDGLSHRVAMYASLNAQSTFTTYLIDPTGSLPQSLAEYPNATGSAPTYYIPAGTLIGQDQGGTTGLTYFATDGLGSVRATFNNGGSQTGLTSYEPYGKPLPDPIEPGVASHLGYSGALTDVNGLIYLNARYYNPGDGQFLSSDPLAGKPADPASFNLYGYVQGNPITKIDLSGRDPNVDPLFAPICLLSLIAGPELCLGIAIVDEALNIIHAETEPTTPQLNITYKTAAQILLTPVTTMAPVQSSSTQISTSSSGQNVNQQQCYLVLKNPCSSAPLAFAAIPLFFTGNSALQPITTENGIVYRFSYAPDGTLIATARDSTGVLISEVGGIPGNLTPQLSFTGKGIVFQRPGALSVRTTPQIRIMDPSTDYPAGYVRVQNAGGNNLMANGKPGSNDDTHLPPDDPPLGDINWGGGE